MVKAPPPPVERIATHAIHIRRQFQAPTVLKVERPPAYYHSGDSGDIIYSLFWVKRRGGGVFYVGPDTKWATNSKLNHGIYHWLLPLIKAQPYIKRAEFALTKPESVTHDLNSFRDLWMDHTTRERHRLYRLFEAYPRRFGDAAFPEDEAWLTVPNPIVDPEHPVVIHRSPRYNNPKFPWIEVARRYGGKIWFVGLKSEYEDWCKRFGNVADYRPVKDALEMARVIAGAKLFVGNQSFPMSVALGIRKDLIQETCEFPDCWFKRPNAQYFCDGAIKWPKFGRRYVVPVPDEYGNYELGPCQDAHGIGDTLTITPLIHRLGGKAVLSLPPSMESIAPLFTNVCPVRFTDDFPVFKHNSNGGRWHMAEGKLRVFGKWPAPTLPKIEITDEEITWAKEELKEFKNPIAFVPTCKKEWTHIRQQSPEFWKEYIELLAEKFTVLQFGYPDYPLVPGAQRMQGYKIREIASLYHVIGRYVGVDTGDIHMMLAVGGIGTVFNPPEQEGHRPKEWQYNHPNVRYVDPSDQEKCDGAVLLMLEGEEYG